MENQFINVHKQELKWLGFLLLLITFLLGMGSHISSAQAADISDITGSISGISADSATYNGQKPT